MCFTFALVCLGFRWDRYVKWCDTLWSWGPESSLCCVQACLSQLSAAALIVVRRHSCSAGHPQQSYQEKTQFKSLPIIKIGVPSCSLLLEAFSSLNFLAHLPPTHPKTRVRWKGPPLFYHIHVIDSWMKYLFRKSKNMYSPLTPDLGSIDFWSTSLPPHSGPPVSQLWWLKGISASAFKCLLGPNFSSWTLFICFCAETVK